MEKKKKKALILQMDSLDPKSLSLSLSLHSQMNSLDPKSKF